VEAPVIAALVALGGVLVGMFGRDIIMPTLLARQKRAQDIRDRDDERARARQEVTRRFADPLLEAVRSLRYRLEEVITQGQSRYLLAGSSRIPFFEYKRTSTLYRLAALLGWIRAFRRERSFLDPNDPKRYDFAADPIGQIERALADGKHIEEQRVVELMRLWNVPETSVSDSRSRVRLAADIDIVLHEFIGEMNVRAASDRGIDNQIRLARKCGKLVSRYSNTEIPEKLVDARADQASMFFGIEEAYIYRDWQTAIGDLMIVPATGGSRRFDVIGFGEFEDRYLRAHSNNEDAKNSSDRRWFDRLESLFHDLDMAKDGMFDARRQQIKNLHQACIGLEGYLTKGPV
jgi:hypothetical protein